MTTKACDPCFYGECERCTSILCACCGEREVATVTSTFVSQEGDDDYDNEGVLVL